MIKTLILKSKTIQSNPIAIEKIGFNELDFSNSRIRICQQKHHQHTMNLLKMFKLPC